MENVQRIEVLNSLIQINNDRIEGYETAANETDELELKTTFNKLSHTSHLCKKDLTDTVIKLGGTPTESTKITGKFFRVWMEVKTALTNKDRKAILNSCEYGEDAALEVYNDVINDDSALLSDNQQAMIQSQYRLLKIDHDKIKLMRDIVLL